MSFKEPIPALSNVMDTNEHASSRPGCGAWKDVAIGLVDRYPEPGAAGPGPGPQIALSGMDTAEAQFSAPDASGTLHVILEVTDAGEPALTSYRRALVKIAP